MGGATGASGEDAAAFGVILRDALYRVLKRGGSGLEEGQLKCLR
jgi:hypothetical protein